MPPDRPKKLRFGDVADALGMTGNTNPLRNWLRRRQVQIEGGYGDGWAEFTFRDLTALALVQQLVEYNVGVERAGQAVEVALKEVWRPEYELNPKLATPSRDIIDPKAPIPLPPRLYLFTDEGGDQRIFWGPPSYSVDANSWIVVDAHRTVSSAITTALELIKYETDSDEFRKKVVQQIDALAEQNRELTMKAAKQAAMQTVQAALKGAGVDIEFAPDGTVKVLAKKPKAHPRQRRSKKKAKP